MQTPTDFRSGPFSFNIKEHKLFSTKGYAFATVNSLGRVVGYAAIPYTFYEGKDVGGVSIDEGYHPNKAAMVWDEDSAGPRAQYAAWVAGAEEDIEAAVVIHTESPAPQSRKGQQKPAEK